MRLASVLAVFALFALLGWLAASWATPRLIGDRAHARMAEAAGGANRPIRPPPPGPDARTVVRPAPDLLYTACAFDLSEGPVRVSAAPWGGYVSVSAFDAATRNFAADSSDSGAASLLLVPPESAPDDEAEPDAVASPGLRGVALIRRRHAQGAGLEAALRAREGDRCETVRG